MNIQELVEKCTNFTVAANINDFIEFGNYLIDRTKKKLEQAVIEDKAETYPTPQQVAKILGVDVVTLWRWKKRGYLVPMEIGGKRRYLMSEVKALMKGDRAK